MWKLRVNEIALAVALKLLLLGLVYLAWFDAGRRPVADAATTAVAVLADAQETSR